VVAWEIARELALDRTRTLSCGLLALALLLAMAGCDAGDEGSAVESRREATTTAVKRTPDAGDIVARHRPAIARALAREARCVARTCSTPAGLRRRAETLAATVAPLDDALGEVHSAEAKHERVATSVLRHAVRQLRSCFLLSARRHGGLSRLDECRGPEAEYHEAVALLRAGVVANGA
jgi:hypothetical protein